MIDLGNMAGGKTDLVAVAGITVSRPDHQFFLRQLAADGLGNGNGGIRCAGHTHSLIYIASSGQGIADRAAQAGGRAAERLDLCGMIVGLILEENKPLFCLGAISVIYFDRDHDRAGIVFVGLFHVGQLSVGLELLHAHDGQIHQADRLIGASRIQLCAGIGIALPCGLDGGAVEAVLELDVFEFRREGGVTAVIGPVSVQHTDLGDGGITVLCITKIGLDKLKIRPGHGKTQGGIQFFEGSGIHIRKAVKNLYVVRLGIFGPQSLRLVHTCLTGIHRIDAVGLDPVHIFLCQISCQQIGDSRAHHGLFLCVEKLQTLLGTVRALVKLTGQGFHGEYTGPLGDLDGLLI